MNDVSLFAHMDTAMRLIALLALCVLPFLMPWPARPRRGLRASPRADEAPAPPGPRRD